VIFNGDVLSRHSIADQIAFHIEKKADVTLHLIDVEDARAFGCVPTDSSGRVTAFLEKMDNPVTNSINAGCYVFSPSVIDEIPLDEVVSIERETFPALVASGRAIFGFKDQSYWLDVGTPAALFKGSRDLVDGAFLAQGGTTIADGAVLTGGTSVGSGCIIEAGVVIDGCIIGDKVVVGAGSHLSQCFVAHGTSIAPDSQKSQKYLSASGELSISL
jgi:mannose-1-phosphate guanylyltransferase